MRPFSIVEGKGFLNFCQNLITIGNKHDIFDINEIIPSRHVISKNIEIKYNELKQKFIESIKEIK